MSTEPMTDYTPVHACDEWADTDACKQWLRESLHQLKTGTDVAWTIQWQGKPRTCGVTTEEVLEALFNSDEWCGTKRDRQQDLEPGGLVMAIVGKRDGLLEICAEDVTRLFERHAYELLDHQIDWYAEYLQQQAKEGAAEAAWEARRAI